jgi:hypothetical protein
MTFEITWTPKLRAEVEHHRCADTFGGFEWFPKPAKLAGPELIAEVEWLLSNGATAWEAADALNRSRASLERLCWRHERNDLARMMSIPRAERDAA